MTPTQRKLLDRVEYRGSATQAELAAVCLMVRDLDARLALRAVPGHIARMVTVMLERVSAGDDAQATVDDYAPWELNHGPDLAPLVKLVALRESVREFVKWVNVSEQMFGKPDGESQVFANVRKALKLAGGGRKKP